MSSDQEDSNIERNGPNDDDDDYDFAEDNNRNRNQRQAEPKTQAIENAPYDEAVEVSGDSAEVPSDPEPGQEEEEEEEEEKPSPPRKAGAAVGGKFEPIKPSADSETADDDEKQVAGAYDPSQYADLPVSGEVKDLFKYITRFRPTTVELNTSIKPFVPDYIPAVGEVDAFLKPSKPDNTPENLGLLTIDEPSLNQSKESTIRLLLNANRKTVGVAKKVVDSIEHAEKNPKEINNWIQAVSKVQRQPPSVGYSKPFPDIDTLMQVWPAEIEDALQNLRLPTGDLDMSLEEYVRLACAITDIPVHNTTTGKNLIESLHVFFTLFAEFKANQHFGQQNEQFVYEGGGQDGY